MMDSAEAFRDPGSFRDPSGHVYVVEGRVFRTVSEAIASEYEFVRDSGLLRKLQESGRVIESWEILHGWPSINLKQHPAPRYLLEHPRLPFISYPYEWPFAALRDAALLHLDLQLDAIDAGACLSDATAYNIQFRGTQPVFIDLLSIRRYRDGEFWVGHRQFCEQFLNPLLMQSLLGVDANDWYRGRLEGISHVDLTQLLPFWRRYSPRVLAHVTLPASLQARKGRRPVDVRGRKLPKSAYVGMLRQLRSWISQLQRRNADTTWATYALDNSYNEGARNFKRAAVAEFVQLTRPALMIDVGCNTGDFSEVALESGARAVIGLDGDHGALNAAFKAAQARGLDLLPLYSDLCNPSPEQGWNQAERAGLNRRCKADAAIALAIVHHLAIGRNIPLPQIVEWLLSMAPKLLVEFVPKSDQMVQAMLRNRQDVFATYSEDAFRAALLTRGRITDERAIPGGDRRLFSVARN